MTEEAGTISHCNKCGPSTYHDVLALSEADAYTKFMSSRKDDSWNQWYEMLRCRGCGQVSLRCTEGYTSKGYTTTYYPPAIARRTPPWVDYVSWVLFEGNDEVPLDICNIMKEVYIALQNNSRRLCAMGIRATLEHTMIDKIGDHGKFVINRASCKIIWNASHNPFQIEAMYLESIRRFQGNILKYSALL